MFGAKDHRRRAKIRPRTGLAIKGVGLDITGDEPSLVNSFRASANG